MNEGNPEALAAAMTAYRFADEDAARRAWLDAHTKPSPSAKAEPVEKHVPVYCPKGHSAWSRRKRGQGQAEKRYCVICHRERQRLARKEESEKGAAQRARDIARARARLAERGIAA